MFTLFIFMKDDLWTCFLKYFRKLIKIYLNINAFIEILLLDIVETQRKNLNK
ncbi:hypothetical protein ETSB_1864 [cyanobacterium endosymbiont of Epithemia turgida isolate EtSB Lake Yunoko]|nr:hypothetical protein ETSB_1864 [cyanobacterium endosymbiont of Epithemia turgida isolate EtSB Lake Yunoko]